MPIFFGNQKSAPKWIQKVYFGDTIVYGHTPVVVGGYLTFSSPSSFTLGIANATKNWDGTLEYSLNTETWNVWDGTSTLGSSVSGSDNVLYLRGTGNTYITGMPEDEEERQFVLTGSNISCTGNIENLLDYSIVALGNHPTMATGCYYCLFMGCTSLTTAPELPATTLTEYCYAGMFYGCTSLTTAPELPATTLAEGCYAGMFWGCASLTTAPELPATTLAESCYSSMFSGCTALTTAPELPATTLAEGCYAGMFWGCTSLTTAPALPATTLAEYCYEFMFKGCTSLTTAPALPATTLAKGCYYYMFNGCTALTTAPALPATTVAEECYRDMFSGCTSLTTAPELPATTLAEHCYAAMFRNCSSLKLSETQTGEYQTPYRIPTSGTGTTAMSALDNMFKETGGTFTGTPEINTTYYTTNTIV